MTPSISWPGPGCRRPRCRRRSRKHLPSGYQAVTGSQLAKENANQVNKNLSVVTDFLLVFALVSLFVGSFIILNTFSILVAQRTRELALFRALGASRRQVLLATLIEAAAVGLVAAVLGVVVGRPAGDRAWRRCSRRSAPASRRTGWCSSPARP